MIYGPEKTPANEPLRVFYVLLAYGALVMLFVFARTDPSFIAMTYFSPVS